MPLVHGIYQILMSTLFLSSCDCQVSFNRLPGLNLELIDFGDRRATVAAAAVAARDYSEFKRRQTRRIEEEETPANEGVKGG